MLSVFFFDFFFFCFFFCFFFLHSSALYNEILGMLLSLEPAVHVQNMSGLNMLQFKVNYILSRIKHNS